MDSQQVYDLAVIGAGIYGIQAARTYLEIHPDHNVIVFEAGKEVGGVWSTERVYNAFWTQTSLGMLEFSDIPLADVPDSETYHGFFPAKYVAKYLEVYLETRIYDGQSLASRIRCNSRVKRLVKVNKGWTIHLSKSSTNSPEPAVYSTHKIIDATGLTSSTNIPTIPGHNTFKGQTIHHKDFALHQSSLLNPANPQKIAVIGGAKSAADVAYACAKADQKVTWIIRRSGAGPAAFVSPKASWPYKNSNESFYTRLTAHFLVSWFFDESRTWLGRLLYRTSFGQNVIKAIWRAINQKAHRLADYDRADGRENGFYNLRPDTEIFWQNDSTGISQRPDFFDTIARGVKVYRENIGCMTPTGLQLADGTIVDVNCIVFATGWRTLHPLIQCEDGKDIQVSLGLSVPYTEHDELMRTQWCELEDNAKEDVLTRFPLLRDRPNYHQYPSADDRAPLRLYKGVIPVHDRSIAFVGQFLSGNNFRISEVQALYAVAALDGMLSFPTPEQMETATARTIVWNRLRYLAKGEHGSWLYWDMVPYTDDLLQELGLRSHRYHGSWWKDLFKPCFANELTGLINEYEAKVSAIEKVEDTGVTRE